MSDPVDVGALIKSDLRPKADVLLQAHEAQSAKLRETVGALKTAREKQDERMLRLHVKTLTAMEAEVANHLSRTAKLLERLEDLDADESFMKHRKEVEKLTSELSGLEGKLKHNYGVIKERLDEANDALEADAAEEDAGEFVEKWAALEAWLRRQLEVAKQQLKDMTALRDAAKKAAESRNARALADAIKASAALVDAKPGVRNAGEDYEEGIKEYDPKKLTKPQQDQFARDRAAFEKIVAEIGTLDAKVVAMNVEIEALEVGVVDVKKAAQVLKVPSALEGKLKKALELDGAGMLKALDALGKELNPKSTGKAMLDVLKKARLL